MTGQTTDAGTGLFEVVLPEFQEACINTPRREAEQLIAGSAHQPREIRWLIRRRAGVLRGYATKQENWVAWMRGLIAEDEAKRAAQ